MLWLQWWGIAQCSLFFCLSFTIHLENSPCLPEKFTLPPFSPSFPDPGQTKLFLWWTCFNISFICNFSLISPPHGSDKAFPILFPNQASYIRYRLHNRIGQSNKDSYDFDLCKWSHSLDHSRRRCPQEQKVTLQVFLSDQTNQLVNQFDKKVGIRTKNTKQPYRKSPLAHLEQKD